MKWKLNIKNVFNPRVKKIINGFALSLAVVMLIFTFLAVNVNKDYGNGIFGYKFFIVLSDSMKPKFERNDIVISKIIETSNLKEGDIISYYENNGTVVTHQIQDIVNEGEEVLFVTKGINMDEDTAGESQIESHKVIGKYMGAIPKGGVILLFLKTKLGYALFIFLPLVIIIGINGYKFYKQYMEYKKNKKDEIEVKKKELEDQNKKLSEELARLKEQLKTNEGSEKKVE